MKSSTSIARKPYSLLAIIFLITSVASSAQQNFQEGQYAMAEQNVLEQSAEAVHTELPQTHGNEGAHDSDSEPMVYKTPRNYASWAREERSRLIAEGADPDSVILMSEIRNHVPKREDDSDTDYVQRYVETMNAMTKRGVAILNDKIIADVVPDSFTGGERSFDLGPGSGATKGEYREFGDWFNRFLDGAEMNEVPERWKKFEKAATKES
jgi:hypothetical protein